MNLKAVLGVLKDEVLGCVGSLPDEYELHFADVGHVDAHTLDWNASENVLRVSDRVVIRVKDAKRAVALVGNALLVVRRNGVHETAIVEDGAIIGEDCYVGPHAIVRSCVTLGNRVRIEAGAVVGNEGFGFVRDANDDWIRFPQLGRVYISDRVEIGANSTIDRGALSDTHIGRDVKINACVHVAHNVRIGMHTVITANVNVSGSAIVGANVWIGPGAVIRDHVTIGDFAYIGMGSTVVKNVPEREVWCGNPARKLR